MLQGLVGWGPLPAQLLRLSEVRGGHGLWPGFRGCRPCLGDFFLTRHRDLEVDPGLVPQKDTLRLTHLVGCRI